MKKLTLYVAALLCLSGCATVQQEKTPSGDGKSIGTSIIGALNSSINAINSGLKNVNASQTAQNSSAQTQTQTPAPAPAPARTHLRDTELKDIISKSKSADWPRIALTINTLPNGFYDYGPQIGRGFSENYCINISITVWFDQKKSKSFDRMDFCGDDIVSDVPFYQVKHWGMTQKAFSGTTGSQRTTGPNPPELPFPNLPGNEGVLSHAGAYYLGSIMMVVGYNWREIFDARFWVVKVPTRAEMKQK